MFPPARRSTWNLACLVRTPAQNPIVLAEQAEMRRELELVRGKTGAALEEMFWLIDRLGAFLQPPFVAVHHAVADADDLLLACEHAEKLALLDAAELASARAAIARHG